jgi:hypothetical protein
MEKSIDQLAQNFDSWATTTPSAKAENDTERVLEWLDLGKGKRDVKSYFRFGEMVKALNLMPDEDGLPKYKIFPIPSQSDFKFQCTPRQLARIADGWMKKRRQAPDFDSHLIQTDGELLMDWLADGRGYEQTEKHPRFRSVVMELVSMGYQIERLTKIDFEAQATVGMSCRRFQQWRGEKVGPDKEVFLAWIERGCSYREVKDFPRLQDIAEGVYDMGYKIFPLPKPELALALAAASRRGDSSPSMVRRILSLRDSPAP